MRLDNARAYSVSDQTTMVAHDLRGPLAALKALARRPDPLGKDKEVLFLVVNRIENIAQAILKDPLQALYPRSAARVADGVAVQDLRSAVESLVDEKAAQWRLRSELLIQGKLKGSSRGEKGLQVSCITQDVQRILSNLIDNAVESFVAGGNIQLGFEVKLGHCVLTVSDNGPGVSAALLPQLGWHKVVSEKYGGHGLGMFYAGELVRSWGGRLRVQSERGTSVRLVLAPYKCVSNLN